MVAGSNPAGRATEESQPSGWDFSVYRDGKALRPTSGTMSRLGTFRPRHLPGPRVNPRPCRLPPEKFRPLHFQRGDRWYQVVEVHTSWIDREGVFPLVHFTVEARPRSQFLTPTGRLPRLGVVVNGGHSGTWSRGRKCSGGSSDRSYSFSSSRSRARKASRASSASAAGSALAIGCADFQ